jgi:two-component system phosphate regulon sensor histidine kinase PhoR
MADPNTPEELANDQNSFGYAQAMKYGRDLARLYTLEKAKRRELELANQKLQAMLQTAPNGLAVLDEAMTIVQTNPRFEALVEKADDCLGRPLNDVLSSQDLITALETASKEGKHSFEIEVAPSGLVNRTLHVIGAALSAGELGGWVISLHDITERKRLEGLKEEFINIAAHELRTPLAIILGYASVLREEMLEASDDSLASPILDSIIQAASRLKVVIDELVGFASIKNTSTDYGEAEQFNLQNVIQNIVNSMSHQSNLKNVTIATQLGNQPLTVSGDRVILAQAIGHLLNNAIKFSQPGSQVEVRAFTQGDDIIIEVEDSGIGIPSADLDKIFDMFYQVEEHMTRAAGGLGMGLCIARHGVELHGGQLTVKSTLGQGSIFRITLPPEGEKAFVPSQLRLDTAHQQTLAYGHDLARAFATQQAMLRRLRYIAELGNDLLDRLEEIMHTAAEEEITRQLNEARHLAHQLVAEASDRSDKEKK